MIRLKTIRMMFYLPLAYITIFGAQAYAADEVRVMEGRRVAWSGDYYLRFPRNDDKHRSIETSLGWARSQPGHQHQALFRIQPGRAYKAKSRLADAEGVLWYELEDGSRSGFVVANDLRSAAAYDELNRITSSLQDLPNLIQGARKASTGPLKNFGGVYRLSDRCKVRYQDDYPHLFVRLFLLLTLKDDVIIRQNLIPGSSPTTNKLKPSRIYTNKDGRHQLYTTGDVEIGFLGNHYLEQPTITKTEKITKIDSDFATRCTNEDEIIEDIGGAYTELALRVPHDKNKNIKSVNLIDLKSKSKMEICENVDTLLKNLVSAELSVDPAKYDALLDFGAAFGADYSEWRSLISKIETYFDISFPLQITDKLRSGAVTSEALRVAMACKN